MKILFAFFTLFLSLHAFASMPQAKVISLTSDAPIVSDSLKDLTAPVARLLFENTCDSTIHLYLKHLNLDGDWDGDGPYEILSGETILAAFTSNKYFYFGGYTTDGKYVWKGDHPTEMNDGSVLMLIEEEIDLDRSGDWTTEFHCE